jgi:hypothetical protein
MNGVTSTYNTAITGILTPGDSSFTASVSGFARVVAMNDGTHPDKANTVHSATAFWSTQFTADSTFSVRLHLNATADLGSAAIMGAADAFTQAMLSIDDFGANSPLVPNYVRLSFNAFELFSPAPQGPDVTYRAVAPDGTFTIANSITVALPAGTYTFSARFNAMAEFSEYPDSGFVPGSGSFSGPETDAVPEPATVTLLGIGLAGMGGYGWRWRKPR